MKKIFAILILLSIPAFAVQSMKPGDDAVSVFKNDPPIYKTSGPKVIDMKEGKIDFYKYSKSSSDTGVKFLVVQDKYVIGVLQQVKGMDQFLFDVDGDGILDASHGYLVVPYWVVSVSPDTVKNSTNNVKAYLDELYEMFNASENPYTSGRQNKLLVKLIKSAASSKTPNRDVLYALFSYNQFGNASPYAALKTLQYLTNEYTNRFDDIHQMLYLYTVESLINLGRDEDARGMAAELADFDGAFVPAQVYVWQLEKDAAKKKKLYEELKSKHPDHWIVKQI